MATTTISEHPADEPGALDGWAVYCDRCECVVLTGSLRAYVDVEAQRHLRWHAEQDARSVRVGRIR